MAHSREELIQVLTDYKKKHGRLPSKETLNEDENLPQYEEFVDTFLDISKYEELANQQYLGVAPYSRQEFGWNQALISASFEPCKIDTTLTRVLDAIKYIENLNRPFNEDDIKIIGPLSFRCTSVRKTLGLIDCYKGQFKTDLGLILGMEHFYSLDRPLKISDVTDSSFETFIDDHPDHNYKLYYAQNMLIKPRTKYLEIINERYISFDRAVKLAHLYQDIIL